MLHQGRATITTALSPAAATPRKVGWGCLGSGDKTFPNSHSNFHGKGADRAPLTQPQHGLVDLAGRLLAQQPGVVALDGEERHDPWGGGTRWSGWGEDTHSAPIPTPGRARTYPG